MKTLIRPLKPEFTFAGFTFPRYIANLETGSLAARLKRRKESCCSGYYSAPRPNTNGAGFYLRDDMTNADSSFSLRWDWCDDIAKSIRHEGWFADKYGDQTIRGVVFALPHSRGWLAGWSMGVQMASSIETDCVYTSSLEAAHAANDLAQRAAEEEREYQAEEERKRESEEAETEEREAAYWAARDIETV